MCLSTATKKDWNATSNTMLEKSADVIYFLKKTQNCSEIPYLLKEVCQNF